MLEMVLLVTAAATAYALANRLSLPSIPTLVAAGAVLAMIRHPAPEALAEMLTLGVAFLLSPDRSEVSLVENRRLATVPPLTWQGLKDGSFTRSLEGEWCLSDAGSRNGTFAGRDRLAQAEGRPIADETVIRIGPHALLFLTPPALVTFLESR